MSRRKPREITTDAGTPVGVTVGIVDAIELLFHILAARNLQAPEVQEALRSLVLSDDLQVVVECAGGKVDPGPAGE